MPDDDHDPAAAAELVRGLGPDGRMAVDIRNRRDTIATYADLSGLR
ncbi:hypothetical protein [Intrasporangium oryzae]|nr:hypothetical protein [Intrasporangium oryzae]